MRLAALVTFVLASGLAASLHAAAELTLHAEAGLNGVGRPGRWAPVRVTLENGATDLVGELVLEWGDSRVTRALAVAARTRHELELYIRASDARASVRVTFVAHGRVVQAIDAPVRLAGRSEVVTAALTPRDAPRSWRGYDAVDRVDWDGDTLMALSSERRAAFAQWRALRELEDSNGLVSPLRVYAAGGMRMAPAALLFIYPLLVGVAGLYGARSARPKLGLLALFAAIFAATALMAARGSSAAAPVVVRHNAVVQGIEGVDTALVSVRGIVVFPAFGDFALRPLLSSATIDTDPAGVTRLDESGDPVLSGTYGLGAKQAFTVEGTAALRVIERFRSGDGMRLVNTGRYDLHACEVATDNDSATFGPLPAGGSAQLNIPSEQAAVVSCVTTDEVVRFVETRRGVRTSGSTRIVYRLQPLRAGHDPG